MSSFALGLSLGVVLGAGGVYLALETPWASRGEQVAVSALDAGPGDEIEPEGKGKRSKRGKRGKNKGGNEGEGALQEIDERVVLSAADRTMSSKGPKISLPNSSVDFSAGAAGRPLNDGEIDAGVRAGQGAIVACIGEARGQAELAAKITLEMLVGGEGSVTKVRVQAPNYLIDNGLYECATKATRKMRFASTGAPTLVTVPFDLSY